MKLLFAIVLVIATAVPSLALCGSGAATYEITIDLSWTVDNNGATTPDDAHFSPPTGYTHPADESGIWYDGGVATEGIELLAETGSPSTFNMEIADHQEARLASIAFGFDYGSVTGVETYTTQFVANQNAPAVTFATMLAPSPDWFTGVSGFNLCSEDMWMTTASADLYAWDAGTDCGTDFTSENCDAGEGMVSLINDSVSFELSHVVGTVTFTLLSENNEEVSDCMEEDPAVFYMYLDTFWSADNNGDSTPADPHFSPILGSTASHDTPFWKVGDVASEGLRRIANVGDTSIALSEYASRLYGQNIFLTPGFDSPVATAADTEFIARPDAPFLSFATMVAPSNDWFLGVSNLNLCDGGSWVEHIAVDLFAMDAGTDMNADRFAISTEEDEVFPHAGIDLVSQEDIDAWFGGNNHLATAHIFAVPTGGIGEECLSADECPMCEECQDCEDCNTGNEININFANIFEGLN
jgi:hypothetical protein